jgi:hypothetical protein
MSNKTIHIISFDIPYPPIYGGIIDIFYKIKTLHQLGYDIILHCFQYKGKDVSNELDKYCQVVHYYQRKKAYKVFFNIMPYIVSSRSNDELLDNLLKDDHPIIFEGLHTCFYLAHPSLKGRNKMVWMHNIEWDYYHNLGKADKNFIHKIHFNVESKKLKMFETVLKSANTIFSVNQGDADYMRQYCENSIFIPPFHFNEEVSIHRGIGDFVLYHGSLDVIENHQAALYLIQTVFSKIDKKVIIAGKQPKTSLIDLVKKYPHISLRADLPKAEFDDLIHNAQCNVLFTFQATGLKHKLINSLYKGRFVIVNDKMVSNSGLDNLCVVANTPEEIIQEINRCWEKEVSTNDLDSRKKLLSSDYSNMSNAKKMIPFIEKLI